jgi:HSP20 family protein
MKELAQSLGDAVVKQVGRVAGRFQERRPLSSDLLETDDEFLVVFDVPGATASDIDVRYEGGAVQVTVDRFREYHEGFEMRFPGRGLSLDGFRHLPEEAVVDADEGRAQLSTDGTLSVFLPKRSSSPETAGNDAPFTDRDEEWAEPPDEEHGGSSADEQSSGEDPEDDSG